MQTKLQKTTFNKQLEVCQIGSQTTGTVRARKKDPVFAKTSPKRSFSMSENERFGLVFAKTGLINAGSGLKLQNIIRVIRKLT